MESCGDDDKKADEDEDEDDWEDRRVLTYSPDGKLLLLPTVESCWDDDNKADEVEYEDDSYGFRALTYSPDGKLLAFTLDDKIVRICDPLTGTLLIP